MLDRTAFRKARKENVRTSPYPHMVIEDALDPDFYQALARSRPPYPGNASVSNRRMAVNAWVIMTTGVYGEAWTEFARLHTQPDIHYRVMDLFKGHLADTLPRLPRDTTRWGVLGLDRWDTADALTDARLETISPAHAVGSHRRGHLDTPNRLFSALLYMRADDDDSIGGGLDLFRWKNGPKGRLDVFEMSPHDIEHVTTVPYRANTLVIYPNSMFALHGSQERQPTPHDRAYVFITAEVQNDLF